ncbi:MAG: hypothetical protein HWN80_02875 [Candidatus Lokiarchaeota archaeon]|nr:hypothetical protein [Candidatus Lokiarchaeota archaeon]
MSELKETKEEEDNGTYEEYYSDAEVESMERAQRHRIQRLTPRMDWKGNLITVLIVAVICGASGGFIAVFFVSFSPQAFGIGLLVGFFAPIIIYFIIYEYCL